MLCGCCVSVCDDDLGRKEITKMLNNLKGKKRMKWLQIYLFIYAVLFALSFRIKTLVQLRQTGIDPYRFNKSKSPQQRFLARYGNLVSAGWLLAILGYALLPDKMSGWGFPLFFEQPVLRIAALALSAFFLIGLIAAQWQMGNSWRIGIDEEHATELVTTGFFRYMRNPVFTMILGGLGAMAFALPGAVTWLLWCMSFSGLYFQVLEEEAFLQKMHGEKCAEYKNRTGRFLPRFPGFKPEK